MPLNDKSDAHLTQQLIDAARLGYLEEVRGLLKRGADINGRDSFGDTALAWAARNRHTQIALLLIDDGADLNSRNERGNTALVWAAMNDNAVMVRALLAKGADPTIKNAQGSTALSLTKDKPTVGPEVVRMIEDVFNRKVRAKAKEEAEEKARLSHDAVSAKQQLLKQRAGRNKPTIKFGFFLALMFFTFVPCRSFAEEKMKLESAAIKQDAVIPQKYTCNGDNISPDLAWSGVSEKTKSFALIADDPDAPHGTWVHWVVYNIPGDRRALPAAIPAEGRLEGGMLQGINDSHETGYGGPCPPVGHGSHRYFFKLYALNDALPLAPGASKADLEKAMKGHILAQTELMGRFER